MGCAPGVGDLLSGSGGPEELRVGARQRRIRELAGRLGTEGAARWRTRYN